MRPKRRQETLGGRENAVEVDVEKWWLKKSNFRGEIITFQTLNRKKLLVF